MIYISRQVINEGGPYDQQASSEAAMPTTCHDLPPHATSYGFKILPEYTTTAGAYVTEEVDSDTGEDEGAYTTELYEVFATRKQESQQSKASAPAPPVPPTPPPTSIVPPTPSTSTGRTPQY